MNDDLINSVYRYVHEIYMCTLRQELVDYYNRMWNDRWNDYKALCYNRALMKMELIDKSNQHVILCQCCKDKYKQDDYIPYQIMS